MSNDTVMADNLITRAKQGDSDAFETLTTPYKRALLTHCYRMLGSYADAEDVMQDTLLAAWQGLAAFEARASVRTWLYKIATNRALNALRATRRRAARQWDVPGIPCPEPTRLTEIVWLEPFPASPLAEESDPSSSPEALMQRSQAISLAFVTGLQRLPPRQLAVIVLRDVIGFSTEDVAAMLDVSADAVSSALKRARSSLQSLHSVDLHDIPAPLPTAAEKAIVAGFVSAWEAADVDKLVSLLTDDVFMSMPPMPYEYHGRQTVLDFCAGLFGAGRRFHLVPVRANGQPAFGAYLRTETGDWPGVGLYVLTLAGNAIGAMFRFESHVLPWFGLPMALSADYPARTNVE